MVNVSRAIFIHLTAAHAAHFTKTGEKTRAQRKRSAQNIYRNPINSVCQVIRMTTKRVHENTVNMWKRSKRCSVVSALAATTVCHGGEIANNVTQSSHPIDCYCEPSTKWMFEFVWMDIWLVSFQCIAMSWVCSVALVIRPPQQTHAENQLIEVCYWKEACERFCRRESVLLHM